MTSKQMNQSQPPSEAPTPGVYRHYKGKLYQVLGMARHSETEEWLVVYQALYGESGFWLRPLGIWLEPVSNSNAVLTNEGNPKPSDVRFMLAETNDISLDKLSQLN